MEWMDNLNSIMAYIENHLDGELDREEIARLAACPFVMFQRVFAIIANVSLTDYVRNRRLTKAAYALRHTKSRVIDIALQYGYESPDAFTTAFRRVMGVSPSQARRGNVPIANYPPLRFKLSIIGVTSEMEIIKTYKQAIPRLSFIGKKYGEPGIWHWEEWFNNGWFGVIENAAGGENKVHQLYEDGDAYIGMMRFKPDDESLEYWIGELVSPETPVPEGFLSLELPSCNLGVCWIYGPAHEIFGKDYECYQKLSEAGMDIITEPDGAIWSFERRGCPRMTTPDEKGNYILDYCYFVK